MRSELESIASDLGFLLSHMKLKIVTAESCTGGWIAEAITSISGSSTWFDRGLIPYSNEAKRELLNVNLETLEKYGAVSEQVVKEMAIGALRHSKADLALAVSGIAGPRGGTADKPVGLVWFAWFGKSFPVTAKHQNFKGDRQHIREQAVKYSLTQLMEILQGQVG